MKTWLTTLLVLVMTVTTLAADPALVRQGKPAGEMVLHSDATYLERFAANDFRHWVEQMTGVKLKLVSTPSAEDNTKLYIGHVLAQSFTDDLARLKGNDGFAIRRKGKDVYVFGSQPRGTAYGLWSLLERNTDIIFARPNLEIGTIYGKHDNLLLTQVDVIDIPVIPYRGYGAGHPPHQATEEWRLRMRNNNVGRNLRDPQWGMVVRHTTDISKPLWDQYDQHPDYFALNPITRKRPKPFYFHGSICVSYPGIAKIWAKAAIEELRAFEKRTGQKVEIFDITPGDNWDCCHCDKCLAPIKLPDGTELVAKSPDPAKDSLFRSTQFFNFLHEAMDDLVRELPDVKIRVLAYIYLAEPPAVEVDPRILIYLAAYPTNSMRFPLLDPNQPAQWRNRFEGWLKKTQNLGTYEYFYPKLIPQAYYIAANLRAMTENRPTHNITGYAETSNDYRGAGGIGEALNWDVGAMNLWVISRLLWNPNQDVDELYRDYIQRTYREAAPLMQEHFDLLKSVWLDPKNKTGDAAHAGLTGIYNGVIVEPGHEARVKQLLAQAEQTAQHEHSKEMIRRMRLGYETLGRGLNRLILNMQGEMSADGDKYISLQWEQPEAIESFLPVNRLVEAPKFEQTTKLKAAHDGKTLYLRLAMTDPVQTPLSARPLDQEERWPAGDHVEIWFTQGAGKLHVFAFDANGNTYDAFNYDRSWNSNWKVITQQTADGWEAIVRIPFESLGLKRGDETKMQWFIQREIKRDLKESLWVSYQGRPLFNRFYPVVVE